MDKDIAKTPKTIKICTAVQRSMNCGVARVVLQYIYFYTTVRFLTSF